MSGSIHPVLLALAALFAAVNPFVLHAHGGEEHAETATEEAADNYAVLFSTIEGAVNVETAIDNQIETIKETYRQDADIFLLETLYPGLIDQLAVVMRPYLIEHSENVSKTFRPRNIQTLRDNLTEDEAVALNEFYSSSAGQSLLRGFGESYRGEAVLGDFDKLQDDVDPDDVSRDVQDAAIGSVRQMSTRDSIAMTQWFAKHPDLLGKLSKIGEANARVRADMENEPMNPKLERHFADAIADATEAHIASFDDEPID
jgi:hypothetical protein